MLSSLAPAAHSRLRSALRLPSARVADVAAGAGALLVAAGVALVYLPAGLIVLGLLLVIVAVYGGDR